MGACWLIYSNEKSRKCASVSLIAINSTLIYWNLQNAINLQPIGNHAEGCQRVEGLINIVSLLQVEGNYFAVYGESVLVWDYESIKSGKFSFKRAPTHSDQTRILRALSPLILMHPY